MCVQYYKFQNPANNNIIQAIQYIEHHCSSSFFYKLAFLQHKSIKQQTRIAKTTRRAIIKNEAKPSIDLFWRLYFYLSLF